ncbi:MAG: class I SAM-dependent methyltransferase [Candidatus Omnitrophica bacterium]|nr:class I SAM-dependent methyltransferase [Candidatus Omnitrophota bacterium]
MQIEQYQRFYELEDKHWWFVGMRNIFYRFVNDIYRNKTDLKILDVGCGAGMIMKDLGKFGEVTGIDVEPAAMEFCHKRNIGKLCLGSGINLPFRSGVFDLVIAFNVVEHVQDDISFVKELDRVCKGGGRVILATSAFNFLWSQHDEINRHKRRYLKSGLQMILENRHLAVERITYTNCILFLPIFLAITLKKLLRRNGLSLINAYYSAPALINRFLLFILKIESLILIRFDFPYGVSLLCVGRKA